jgi:hypothetical protein
MFRQRAEEISLKLNIVFKPSRLYTPLNGKMMNWKRCEKKLS